MKKLLAVITCVLMISAVFIVTPSATEPDTSAGQKVALAAYGTPTIDGHIDLVWDKAPAYNIDQVYVTDELTESSATFQVLWDEIIFPYEVQDNDGDLDWRTCQSAATFGKDAISYTFDYDRSSNHAGRGLLVHNRSLATRPTGTTYSGCHILRTVAGQKCSGFHTCMRIRSCGLYHRSKIQAVIPLPRHKDGSGNLHRL